MRNRNIVFSAVLPTVLFYPFLSVRDEKQGARIAINVNVTPLIAIAMLIPRYHEERKSSIKIN